MLETGLKQWLNSKDEPGDFYQLVGLPRLCRDQARLLSVFQEATEYLFGFQNHKDKATRDRARTFQLQVAEARRIVSDRGRWDKYDQDVIDRLRSHCLKNPGFLGPNSKLDDLRRWLAYVQHVDSDRVDELAHIFLAEPQQSPDRKPQAENETLSSEALSTQVLGGSKRDVSLSETPPIPPKADAKKGSLGSAPRTSPSDVRGQKKDVPPPPGRGAARGSSSKAPPPPPKDTTRQIPVPSIVISTQPVSPGLNRPPHHWGANTTLLWIVMGIVLFVLFVAVLALVIAWASGAFAGNRSRAAVTQSDAAFACLEVPESQSPHVARKTSSSASEFC